MKKSERIKVLEEKVEELSRTNHTMEMKLFVVMDKLASLHEDFFILRNEVKNEE